jgi:D-arginine dehydrogenase
MSNTADILIVGAGMAGASVAAHVGYDPGSSGFFWLVGQGGYGIQTAPALSLVAASLIVAASIPPSIAAFGVTAKSLSALRFC